jgi:hypothetical protein
MTYFIIIYTLSVTCFFVFSHFYEKEEWSNMVSKSQQMLTFSMEMVLGCVINVKILEPK